MNELCNYIKKYFEEAGFKKVLDENKKYIYRIESELKINSNDFKVEIKHHKKSGKIIGIDMAEKMLEIGRKIRQKEDEENGVDTYSALWGKTKAVMVFVLILFCVILVAQLIINSVFIIALLVLFAYIVHISAKFLQNSEVKGKKIDTLSAVWVLASYLLIGLEGVI